MRLVYCPCLSLTKTLGLLLFLFFLYSTGEDRQSYLFAQPFSSVRGVVLPTLPPPDHNMSGWMWTPDDLNSDTGNVEKFDRVMVSNSWDGCHSYVGLYWPEWGNSDRKQVFLGRCCACGKAGGDIGEGEPPSAFHMMTKKTCRWLIECGKSMQPFSSIPNNQH